MPRGADFDFGREGGGGGGVLSGSSWGLAAMLYEFDSPVEQAQFPAKRKVEPLGASKSSKHPQQNPGHPLRGSWAHITALNLKISSRIAVEEPIPPQRARCPRRPRLGAQAREARSTDPKPTALAQKPTKSLNPRSRTQKGDDR